jgi:hypothetical protein
MFDVAAGECKLEEFLLTRFDQADLKSKVKVDPAGRVFEQMVHHAPPPTGPFASLGGEPTAPARVVEVPFVPAPPPAPEPEPGAEVEDALHDRPHPQAQQNGPAQPAPDGQDSFAASVRNHPSSTASPDSATLSRDSAGEGEAPPRPTMAPPPPGTTPEELLKLIQSFHAAAERYNAEKTWDGGADETTS